MNLANLIESLQDLLDSGISPDAEVRIAQQPHWPLQTTVQKVICVDINQTDPDDVRTAQDILDDPDSDPIDIKTANEILEGGAENNVVYIVEGNQVYENPYLPGVVCEELGWR